jgi:hypothetical protein
MFRGSTTVTPPLVANHKRPSLPSAAVRLAFGHRYAGGAVGAVEQAIVELVVSRPGGAGDFLFLQSRDAGPQSQPENAVAILDDRVDACRQNRSCASGTGTPRSRSG